MVLFDSISGKILTDVTRYTVARHLCRAEIWLTPFFRVYPKNGAGGARPAQIADLRHRWLPILPIFWTGSYLFSAYQTALKFQFSGFCGATATYISRHWFLLRNISY